MKKCKRQIHFYHVNQRVTLVTHSWSGDTWVWFIIRQSRRIDRQKNVLPAAEGTPERKERGMREIKETSLGRESQKPEICCLIGSLMMCIINGVTTSSPLPPCQKKAFISTHTLSPPALSSSVFTHLPPPPLPPRFSSWAWHVVFAVPRQKTSPSAQHLHAWAKIYRCTRFV